MALCFTRAAIDRWTAKISPAATAVICRSRLIATSTLKWTPTCVAMRRIASWIGLPSVTPQRALGFPIISASCSRIVVLNPARPGATSFGPPLNPRNVLLRAGGAERTLAATAGPTSGSGTHFAWEYKGQRADLDAAFGQLRQYFAGAGEPAAADRLRHGAVSDPHQLDEQRQPDARVRAGRLGRRVDARPAEVGGSPDSDRLRLSASRTPARRTGFERAGSARWWGQVERRRTKTGKEHGGATRRGRRTRARGRERRAPGAEGRRTWERRSPLGRGREGSAEGVQGLRRSGGLAAHQAQHHPTRGDETAREMASGDDGRRANGGRRSTAPESGPAPSQPPTTEGGGGTCRQHGIT